MRPDGPPATPRSPTFTLCGSFTRSALTVTALAHAPGGARLAAGFDDGRVRIYRVSDGRVERVFSPPTAASFAGTIPGVAALAFSADGTLLAVSRSTAVTVYRLSDGLPVAPAASPFPMSGAELRFSDNGVYLLVASPNSTAIDGGIARIAILRVADGQLQSAFGSSHRADWADANQVIVFTDNPTTGDGAYAYYEAATGKLLRQGRLTGPASGWRPVWGGNMALAITPGTGGGPSHLAVFSVPDGARLWQSQAEVLPSQRVEFLPAPFQLAIFGDVAVTLLDLSTRTIVGSLPLPAGGFAAGASLAPDGKSAAGLDGGRLVRTGADGAILEPELDIRAAHNGKMAVLAASHDGKMLASGISETSHAVWLWSIADRAFVRELTGSFTTFAGVFSRDNSFFLRSGDGVSLRRVSDGTLVSTVASEDDTVGLGAGDWAAWADLSPDGSVIVRGSSRTLELYRASDGTLLDRIAAPVGSRAVTFSRDGSLIATSGPELWRTSDRTRLWSTGAATHQPPLSHTPPYDSVAYDGVSFTPDESALLVSQCLYDWAPNLTAPVCSPPKLVRASDGAVLHEYPAARGPRPRLSPDGTWMVAGDDLVDIATGARLALGVGARLAVFLDATTIAAATEAGDIELVCLK